MEPFPATEASSPAPRHIDFPLGRLLSTPGALAALAQAGQDGSQFLQRHRTGDWGDVGGQDRAANDRAVVDGDRILSAYTLKDGTRLWIITESDRSATTLLLPDEY
jgi:hypothetical protein